MIETAFDVAFNDPLVWRFVTLPILCF